MAKTKALTAPKRTTLYVSNHLVNARYNYSMIQERIFNYVIFYCQKYIDQVKAGVPVVQIDMFSNLDHATEINIPICLSHVSAPDMYDHVRDAALKMCSVVVSTREEGKWTHWQGMFKKLSVPEDLKRSKYIHAVMDIEVAKMIISMRTKMVEGRTVPINYTTFLYEVALNTKNKYTPRMYKLISSYKKRGEFKYTVEELRDLLGLGTKYKDTEALKRRILKPVMEELKKDADIYFDMELSDFEIKEGNKVIAYNFKIQTHDSNLHYVKYKKDIINNIIYMLKAEYQFTSNHIEEVRPYFENDKMWNDFNFAMEQVNQEVRKNKAKNTPVVHLPRYTITSIIKHCS